MYAFVYMRLGLEQKKHNCWRYFVQSSNIQVSEIEIMVMKESINV